MPSPAIPHTSLKGREHLYSLYTSIPRPPPAFNSLPAVRSDHLLYSTQRKQVTAFDQLVEEGGAVHALKDVLTKEIKRVGKSRVTRVIDARGKQRKGRGRGKQQVEGEQGESEDAGDEFTETPRRSGPKKGGGRTSTYLERMAMPEVRRPQVFIPDNLPPGDLLASLHLHASTLLTASYNLLPPLTPLAPKYSPPIIAHFDALAALTAQEEAATIARSPREETLQKLRGKRIVQGEGVKSKSKSMLAGRREAWRDGEKAWEGSSLLAVGMFMQLLAAEVVSKTLIEALPPDRLPPLPPLPPQPEALEALDGEGSRKRRRVDKGKGKARAEEEEEEEEDLEMLQAQAMFDPLLMGLGRDGEVAQTGEEGWGGSEWEL